MSKYFTFSIGDIHGCLDELKELVSKCIDYADEHEHKYRFIFLGDYIDRGPNSKGVIDYLWQFEKVAPCIFLKGNHEEWCLQTIRGTQWGGWEGWGGLQTMNSFGVLKPADIPEKYLLWMANLRLTYEDRHRIYVHAGLRPEHDIMEQAMQDFLWIREEFLESDYSWGKLVVHGHTKLEHGLPQLFPNRLNLDTHCFGGKKLSAAVFIRDHREPLEYIQVQAAQVYFHRE